jgi:predicted enzyme related to lactoylglutathione lyase
MITGPAGASIWSEDHRKLVPFYRDTLGLQVAVESESAGVVVFGDYAGTTLLVGTHSEVKGRNPDPARHMVALLTDDARGDCARLKAAGVAFIQEPTQQGDLVIATLQDPEGNLIQLLQRG